MKMELLPCLYSWSLQVEWETSRRCIVGTKNGTTGQAEDDGKDTAVSLLLGPGASFISLI